MLYVTLSEENQVAHEEAKAPRKVDADGTVRAMDYEEVAQSKGFRPGMLPLRSMKMQWTLTDFLEMDEKFVYRLKRQEQAFCRGVSVETHVANDFQALLRQTAFHQCRVGYLYGSFTEEDKVVVKAMYEPPQRGTAVDVELLDDPRAAVVEKLAGQLGLERVGWVFGHPPREEGFHFASPEIFMAAEGQLEAAEGVGDTPYVTLMVSCDEDGQATFEGYQVSKQCMEMVAEGVLEVGENPGECRVNETFTVIVEAKAQEAVDNDWFLANVPIEQHESEELVYTFPAANREDLGVIQTQDHLRAQLEGSGSQGWSLVDKIADFHLLLYLCNILSIDDDLPRIAQSIRDREVPLDDGFVILLNNLAGLA